VRVDLALMESTYGDRRHRDRAGTLREFGEILAQAKRDGGNVLIPAFAVGRSQDVAAALRDAFRGAGVRAEVPRPGLRLDLGRTVDGPA
jgi:Cft2 family RNA processing exonuclease